MGKGKYQKILEKRELTYDDLLVLAAGKKIKGISGAIVIIKHNGTEYLKLTNPENFKHLLK
ncbi:hypothetical protein LJB90_03655 [Eubacteriales bacterium OttesenSCG-928-G02]|nr:hypothetical protein [Eubacteriales bacterium OttesenSCG-928-G02]